MSKYKCQDCKHNNNGWCREHKINGLKAKNIQECDSFRGSGTVFTLTREGKDFYGQEMILIKINDEVAEVPIIVLENFIKDKTMRNQEVKIPH